MKPSAAPALSRRRDALHSTLLAGAVGAAAAALSFAGAVAPLDAAIYDRLSTRLAAPPDEPLSVIVGIDEPSFADLGLAWPWPRDLHARLIEQLRAAGARTVALDIVFADPGDPAADAALAAAMGPDVVLASDIEAIESPQGLLSVAVDPLPTLTAGGARHGRVGLPLDPDGVIRALPRPEHSFAAAALGGAHPAPPAGALIDYATPPGEWPRVSYYQALDPEGMLPPGLFEGRIVLVGLSLRATPEASGVELFRTPWTARDVGLTAGVEVQAHAIETLARGSWTRPAPVWLIPATALAAAAAALAARGRGAPAGGATAAGLALVLVAASAGALAAGWWAPPAAPALAALAAGIGQSGLDHARERRARRELRRAFEHYLSPEMVRRLARDPSALRLGGERRMLTIMFCDLRGFTTLSEAMRDEPEALTTLVNRALTAVADAVHERHGMVDKFIGDCVMGVWNAPLDTPGHARLAIEAGVAAIEGVARLSRELASEAAADGRKAPEIACGVGINTGECVVGNMGSARRFDYTALGDPVNLAARLETMTKECGVSMLVGESTAAAAGFTGLVEIDELFVKGRTVPVRVFAPTALWPGVSDAHAALQGEALAARRAGDSERADFLWRKLAAAAPTTRPYVDRMTSRTAEPALPGQGFATAPSR